MENFIINKIEDNVIGNDCKCILYEKHKAYYSSLVLKLKIATFSKYLDLK